MGDAYSADEIFRIGIEIEKNGQAFYEEAARRSTDPACRKVFADLANWERQHVAVFEELRAAAVGAPPVGLEDQLGEVESYLKAIADTHVFVRRHDPAALAAGCQSPAEALEAAIGFEKDSVVVYSSMRHLVPERLGRDKIEALIDEELRHMAILQDLLARQPR
ncbi:MAG: ferritin family protein [Deltaproteobacteria bacterium]|nr:ferritin family protein [Deltaproteobacteria bacterium]